MATTRPDVDPDRPVHYEIRVEGRLAPRWATWFAGMTLTADDDGTTLLRGPLTDQSALHGVLAGLRDLGVPLVSVNPTAPVPPCGTPTTKDTP